MDFSISSKWNASAFQVTFFEMLSAWSACFLADTTRISRGMNHRACKERRPCVGTFVSFRQGRLRNVPISSETDRPRKRRRNRSESDPTIRLESRLSLLRQDSVHGDQQAQCLDIVCKPSDTGIV